MLRKLTALVSFFALFATSAFAADSYYNVAAKFTIPGGMYPADHNAIAVAGKKVSVTVSRVDGSEAYRYDYTVSPQIMPDGTSAIGMAAQVFSRNQDGSWVMLMEPSAGVLPGQRFSVVKNPGIDTARNPDTERAQTPFGMEMTITPVSPEEVAAQFGGNIPEPKACSGAIQAQLKDDPVCCTVRCANNPEMFLTCCGAVWCCDCGSCCRPQP